MIIQTHISIKQLGACSLQEGKPVYFAGKLLTEAQKGYVAMELESLVVAWAIEKFHHFLYDNHFILESDQKALEASLSKKLKSRKSKITKNSYQNFPILLHSMFIPGLTNQLANYISRLGTQKDTIKLPKLHLYQITNQLNARSGS